MATVAFFLKSIVAATVLGASVAVAQGAGEDPLSDLFIALQSAEGDAVSTIELKIIREWSKSGSASMDLLLERGREALQEEEWDVAVEHLSALVDHSPDFAEGWNTRATAYFQMGQLGLSLSDIQHTLALNPRHFGALSGLGIIMEELGQEAAALEAWREVEKLTPGRPDLDEALERLERRTRGQAL